MSRQLNLFFDGIREYEISSRSFPDALDRHNFMVLEATLLLRGQETPKESHPKAVEDAGSASE